MREGASEGEGERGTDGREGERGGEDADASPPSRREADRGEQGEGKKKKKENEKEGKDQGNMGEGEGRSPSEGACVKVAVREGASLIPCASYQTVSRLQQLLSAQNTQALPFQLKGSLTKSEEEKKEKIPCRQRAALPPAQGALRWVLHHPGSPSPPAPGVLAAGGAKSLQPREVAAGCESFPARPWGPWLILGCNHQAQLSLQAQVMGLGEGVKGWGQKAPQRGWGWPGRGAVAPVGSIRL